MFQQIREGTMQEALRIFESLSFKAEQFDRLRRHAVSEDEVSHWNELRLTKYPELSNRKAAQRIEVETESSRSAETIRRHLLGTGANGSTDLVPSVARRRKYARQLQEAADQGDPTATGYMFLTHVGALALAFDTKRKTARESS